MNEIALSSDLNVITAEINSYKQIAGQSIFEIGRRLKHVKENNLVHGEWIKWLESIEMNRKTAHRFITVYEKLPADVSSMGHLGVTALYEIATLPQEEREKEHVTSKGETKTVDEMTVRELQEVKRKLKMEQKERERLEQENEALANREPERIEVIPDDYDYIKGNYESAISLRDRYKEQLEEMRKELEQHRDLPKQNDSEIESLKKKEDMLKGKINSYEKLYDIQSNLEMILSAIQPKMHSFKTENIKNEYGVIDEFESTLDEVIKVCNKLKNKLPNKNIIEGEIVNEI